MCSHAPREYQSELRLLLTANEYAYHYNLSSLVARGTLPSIMVARRAELLRESGGRHHREGDEGHCACAAVPPRFAQLDPGGLEVAATTAGAKAGRPSPRPPAAIRARPWPDAVLDRTRTGERVG